VTCLTNRTDRVVVIAREPLGDFWAIAPGSSLQLVLKRDDDIEDIGLENGIITFDSWGWDLRLFHHGRELNAGRDPAPIPNQIEADEAARMADLGKLAESLSSGNDLDWLVKAAILYTLGDARFVQAREIAALYVNDDDERLRRAGTVAVNLMNGLPADA